LVKKFELNHVDNFRFCLVFTDFCSFFPFTLVCCGCLMIISLLLRLLLLGSDYVRVTLLVVLSFVEEENGGARSPVHPLQAQLKK
jgi:hypothetical protein